MDIIAYSEGHRIFRESFRRFLEREIITHIEELGEGVSCSTSTIEIMKSVVARNLGV
jgi:hypothetical protein